MHRVTIVRTSCSTNPSISLHLVYSSFYTQLCCCYWDMDSRNYLKILISIFGTWNLNYKQLKFIFLIFILDDSVLGAVHVVTRDVNAAHTTWMCLLS